MNNNKNYLVQSVGYTLIYIIVDQLHTGAELGIFFGVG